METQKWHFKLSLLVFCYVLSPVASFDVKVPSHGCYWNLTCQEKWWGDCGHGHVISGQSRDCKGLCSQPRFPLCSDPYYTRLYCCICETPKVTADGCAKCDRKVDSGEEFFCCTDCSDPQIVSDNPKLGYCRSGAEIIMEPKPKEIFKWIAGPWKPCSSSCDGGMRQRNVQCHAVFADTMIPDYPAYDEKCSAEEMPAREEPCNLRSCSEKTTWTFTVIVSVGIIAFAGIGLGGYIQYRRKSSMQYGQVYTLMEGHL